MRLGTAALTLSVALGFAGLASAQESGNWLTRWFTPTPDKIEPVKKDVKADTTSIPASTSNNRIVQAKADLERRREVCLKLREVGLATGDDELVRKAELLDQRAYDLFLAAKNQGGASVRPAVDTNTKKGAR